MQLPQLTFTRFIAALIVLIFHGARGTFPFTVYPGRYVIEYGSIAVVYFFILSGFILTITYQSALERTGVLNRWQFWLARFARIYPLYLFALILTVLIQIHFYEQPVTPGSLLASLTLIQAWFPSLAATLNGPGWSLSVEVFFYALFPALFPVLTTLSNRVLMALSGVSWLAGIGLFYLLTNQARPASLSIEEYHNLLNYSPWIHLATFINGCLSGLLFWRYVRQPVRWVAHNQLSWFMLLAGVAGLVIVVPQSQLMLYAQGGLLTPVFVLFITGLALQTDSVVTNLFAWRPLVYLGEISYGLYILQLPLIRLFKHIDPLGLGDTILRDVSTFGALFMVTIGCYHLVEKPAQQFIRTHWLHKRVRLAKQKSIPSASA